MNTDLEFSHSQEETQGFEALSSRRFAYIEVDWEHVQRLLGSRKIKSHRRLSGGAANTNYKILTETNECFVYRCYARGTPKKDHSVMSLVKSELPVPEILEMDDDWALMQFLPGRPISDKSSALVDVGKCLAIMSQVRFEQMGAIVPGGMIEPYDFGGFRGYFKQCFQEKHIQEWLSDGLLEDLQRLVEREADIYRDCDQQTSLVHGDFNPGNILVNNERVTGILDWEFAMAGPWVMDAGNLLRHLGSDSHELLQKGMQSAGMRPEPDWLRRAELVDLTSHLEFLGSQHSLEFKQQCLKKIKLLLSRG